MKLLKTLTEASCYFILIRTILFSSIFFDRIWFDSLNYHHQNEWQWYLFWWIFPIIISLLFSLKLRFSFFKHTGYIVLPFLIIGTIFLGMSDKNYWGYYFKRPSIFRPIKNLQKIRSISYINSNSIDATFNISQAELTINDILSNREDPYYENLHRAFMTIEDNASDEFQNWIIDPNQSTKIAYEELNLITPQIKNSNIIVPAINGYEHHEGNNLSGLIIDFESNKKNYYYVALSGGQISNDHYPFYEFLFEKKDDVKLKQQQMYFYDAAGFEGFEYCILAPPLELFLFLVSGILILLFRGFNWAKKQRNSPTIKRPISDKILDDDL